jgi:very-short-patch-repair endonuclease
MSLVEAVVMLDIALHRRLVSTHAIEAHVERGAGKAGVRTLRDALGHAEPKAESAMETRMRMAFVMAGLPRPEAQVDIRDRFHRLIARVDLYYRDQRLALEYDGATHKDSVAEDNRRQNRLVDMGIRVLRFTAADVYETPELTVSQVRSALAA